MYKFLPTGYLTKIILPYTKNYKVNISNNINEPLTLNFTEHDKIGFFVYQKIFKNKKMYSILEINENVSKNRYEPYEDYIRSSLFITLDNKNNYIEEENDLEEDLYDKLLALASTNNREFKKKSTRKNNLKKIKNKTHRNTAF